MLHTDSPRREKLLAFGASGAGKSSTWVAVADWLEKTHAEAHMLVLDTDHTWDGLRPEDGSLDRVVQTLDLDEMDFGSWRDQVRIAKKAYTRDDWVVLDMADKAWSGAQSYFWQVMGEGDSLAEMYLRSKKDKFSLAGDHGSNWGIINREYGEFLREVMSVPCHVIVVTGQKEVRMPNAQGKGGDDPSIIQEYKGVGAYPSGQKDLPGAFHSVLFCEETKKGSEWRYTTIKERGPINRPKRQYLKGEIVQDFVVSYLIKIGGWKP